MRMAQALAKDRKAEMALLAGAQASRLDALLAGSGLPDNAEFLRGPETGLVTVRGRIGGGGAPFNLGEATVTRATVKLPGGEIGHSYALGRDREKARLAAIIDALWQSASHRDDVERAILAPLRSEAEAAEQKREEETAATRVEFFTMVRGED